MISLWTFMKLDTSVCWMKICDEFENSQGHLKVRRKFAHVHLRSICTMRCNWFRQVAQLERFNLHVSAVIHNFIYKLWNFYNVTEPHRCLSVKLLTITITITEDSRKYQRKVCGRLFGLGRTENINPVTQQSVRWVLAMTDDSCDRQCRLRLLREAVDCQNQIRLEATVGLGCERHLLGLACAANELGMDVPAVFTDKVFSKFPLFLSHLCMHRHHIELHITAGW